MARADRTSSHKMPADTTRPATGSTHAAPKAAPIPAATKREGDPERDGGEGVRQVVERVRQQRHRSAEYDDHRLDERRGTEAGQGDLGCPDPGQTRVAETGINPTTIVAVGNQVTDPSRPAGSITVGVTRELR